MPYDEFSILMHMHIEESLYFLYFQRISDLDTDSEYDCNFSNSMGKFSFEAEENISIIPQ